MRTEKQQLLWAVGAVFFMASIGGVASGGEGDPAPATEEGIMAEVDDGVDVWFREADLDALANQHTAIYGEAEAGDSSPFARAFPDAPPQIPHSVEDMLPLTRRENECLDCHHPDNALSEKDAPLPESHFYEAVLGEGSESDAQRWKVTGYEKGDDVDSTRYNCVMCHTPQATNVATLDSTFVVLTDADLQPVSEPVDDSGKKKKRKKKSKKNK